MSELLPCPATWRSWRFCPNGEHRCSDLPGHEPMPHLCRFCRDQMASVPGLITGSTFVDSGTAPNTVITVEPSPDGEQ